MGRPKRRRIEKNAGAFYTPSFGSGGMIPVPMRTLADDYSDVPEPEDSDRVPEPEEEPGLVRRASGWLFLALVGGVALSVAAFWITSMTPRYAYPVEPCAEQVSAPGFDPWTGQPHGLISDRYGADCLETGVWENPTREVAPAPDELLGRQAIPMPVGFAVGIAITIGAMALMSQRRRRSHRAGQS